MLKLQEHEVLHHIPEDILRNKLGPVSGYTSFKKMAETDINNKEFLLETIQKEKKLSIESIELFFTLFEELSKNN